MNLGNIGGNSGSYRWSIREPGGRGVEFTRNPYGAQSVPKGSDGRPRRFICS
jgi:hypothetical protein